MVGATDRVGVNLRDFGLVNINPLFFAAETSAQDNDDDHFSSGS